MNINSVKPGVPKKATYLSLIAVVLFLAWLNYAVGYNHMPVKNTFWALTPPIMAISLALITKEVYSSLFLGMLTGALLNADFNPVGGLNQLFPNGIMTVLADKWNVGILVFLVILGTMVQLMNRTGGSAALCRSSLSSWQASQRVRCYPSYSAWSPCFCYCCSSDTGEVNKMVSHTGSPLFLASMIFCFSS